MESGGCLRSVVTGSTHQASNKYTATSRGKQCTPISFFAILYSVDLDIKHWTGRTVDFIVDQGDNIYRSVPHAEEYFDYTELPLSMSIPPHGEFVSCSFGNHLSGFMHQSVSADCSLSFTDAIVSACEQAVGCLVTICNTCVAVIHHNGSYFVFDSHSRNSRGMPDDNGSAVLLEFTSVYSLHDHMRGLYAIPPSEDVCLSRWQQRHAERCQFDVVPVISTVGGPVMWNVPGQYSSNTRLTYASVCKKPSPVHVGSASVLCQNVSSEVTHVTSNCANQPSSASTHKVQSSSGGHFVLNTQVQQQQWSVSGKHRDKTKQNYSHVSTAAENARKSLFCCFACGKELKSLQALRLHQFHKHEIQSMADIKKLDSPVVESSIHSVDVFRCSTCFKEFSSHRGLQMHIHRVHRAQKTADATTHQSGGRHSLNSEKKQNQPTGAVMSDIQTDCSVCGKQFCSRREYQ